jgi:hypothetical protein
MAFVCIALGGIHLVEGQIPTVAPTPSPSFTPTAVPTYFNSKTIGLPFTLEVPAKLMAISYDGRKVAIATPYGIYASSDSGNTFRWTNAPIANWRCIVSDSTGLVMYALNSEGEVWTSYGDLFFGWVSINYENAINSQIDVADIATTSDGHSLFFLTPYHKSPLDKRLGNSLLYLQYEALQLQNVAKQFIAHDYKPTYTNIVTDNTGVNLLTLGTNTSACWENAFERENSTLIDRDLPFRGNSLFATSYTDLNQYVYAVINTSAVAISTDNAKTFNQTIMFASDDVATTAIASSGTGQYLVVGGKTKETDVALRISTNYGANFDIIQYLLGTTVLAIAVSENGESIYALTDRFFYSFQQGK